MLNNPKIEMYIYSINRVKYLVIRQKHRHWIVQRYKYTYKHNCQGKEEERAYWKVAIPDPIIIMTASHDSKRIWKKLHLTFIKD